MLRTSAIVCVATLATSTLSLNAQTLRGSSNSMNKQHGVAIDHDYTFLTRSSDVTRFIELGLLVPIKGGTNYDVHAVSFPYGRPAVRTFIERLSAQYRSACGEKLVVTSLTRPTTRQPRNASSISVHPTGMALDLRISNRTSCRRWLERTLLSLEKSAVLEATRERNPAHYHVAVFPNQYAAYVERLTSRSSAQLASAEAVEEPATKSVTEEVATEQPVVAKAAVPDTESGPAVTEKEPEEAPSTGTHRVARGDALWSIARLYDTSVDELQALNGLSSTRIKAGQVLTVPASGTSPVATTASYRVSRGDALWSIARQHGTTVSELKSLNGLASSTIKPGQVLTVPAGDGVSGATMPYRVGRGDTLWSIARQHGTTVAELKSLNGLASSSIKAGQTITVPTR